MATVTRIPTAASSNIGPQKLGPGRPPRCVTSLHNFRRRKSVAAARESEDQQHRLRVECAEVLELVIEMHDAWRKGEVQARGMAVVFEEQDGTHRMMMVGSMREPADCADIDWAEFLLDKFAAIVRGEA